MMAWMDKLRNLGRKPEAETSPAGNVVPTQQEKESAAYDPEWRQQLQATGGPPLSPIQPEIQRAQTLEQLAQTAVKHDLLGGDILQRMVNQWKTASQGLEKYGFNNPKEWKNAPGSLLNILDHSESEQSFNTMSGRQFTRQHGFRPKVYELIKDNKWF